MAAVVIPFPLAWHSFVEKQEDFGLTNRVPLDADDEDSNIHILSLSLSFFFSFSKPTIFFFHGSSGAEERYTAYGKGTTF